MYSKSLSMLRPHLRAFLPVRQLSKPVAKATRDDDLFSRLPPSAIQPKRLAPLKGYLYLPGNQGENMPAYLRGPTEDVPLAFQCSKRDDFTEEDWGKVIGEYIAEYLLKYQGILFRGVPLKDAESFNNLVQKTGYGFLPYNAIGTGHRNQVAGDVYNATSFEKPPYIIQMHSEASYSPVMLVRKIFFYCKSPAPFGLGGETPICKTERFLTELDSGFIDKLRKKKLRYLRVIADRAQNPEICWQNIMTVETREEAEEEMRKSNFGWRWNDNGSLTVWHIKSAFEIHPETGKEIWYNQVTTHHRSYYDYFPNFIPSPNFEDYPSGYHIQYGDGEELEEHYVQQVRDLSWREAVGIQLEAGDVLVLDNLTCQHGRLNYHGKRSMFVALTEN